MTQQTLREEYYKWYWGDNKPSEDTHLFYASLRTNNDIADFFLARFKEFAEKELIGEDEETNIGEATLDELKNDDQAVEFFIKKVTRNALRNKQRATLAEYFK